MTTTTILSDNGASSGSAGLKTTGGNDGTLVLQTTTSGGTATTALTIDTSQNVGVGTSTPSGTLHVKAQSGMGAPLYLSTTDAGANTQVIFSGGRVFQVGTGNASSGFANNLFVYDGTAGATVLQQGRSTYSLALQGASPVVGTGISFPAAVNNSSDVNTLDDYEEGTFTPTVSPASGAFSSLSNVSGTYTKVGNLVTVSMSYQIASVGTASGAVNISNLPFNGITNRIAGVCREIAVNGYAGTVYFNSSTTLNQDVYGGTSPITANAYWLINVQYFA